MSDGITLAIPSFNGARYLERTLQSLRAAGESVRWWLQDNQSTDGSLEIARRFAGPRDIIRSEPDTGQVNALNRAFSQMGGDVIGYINSDDCLCAGAADAVLAAFREHPEIDLVYGEVEMIGAEDERLDLHSGNISSLEEVLDIYNVWWRQRQWVQPEVFWRRSLWERVGGFNERYNLAFDFEFWTRCFRAGARVLKIPRRLAQFRIHREQKSTANEEAANEIRAILRDSLDAAPPIGWLCRSRLEAQLSYDLYQSGNTERSPSGHRRAFLGALLRRPQWLLAPAARQRLWGGWKRRLSFAAKSAVEA